MNEPNITEVTTQPASVGSCAPGGAMPAVGFWQASLWLADQVEAHDFTLRDRLLLGFVRRNSFGAGLCEAYIPRLDLLAAATRMSRGNVSAGLGSLIRRLVIEQRPEFFYGFRLPVQDWKVGLRTEEVEVIRQLELLARPEHIRDAMRAALIERFSGGADAHRPSAENQPGESDSRQPGVPESGTPAISFSRSHFGNGAESSGNTGPRKPVPESGTGLPNIANLQHCQDCSDKGTKAANLCLLVPESGTRRPACGAAPVNRRELRERLLALSGRPWPASTDGQLDSGRQVLFDALGALGAMGRAGASAPFWLRAVRERPQRVLEELLELWPRLDEVSIGPRLNWALTRGVAL